MILLSKWPTRLGGPLACAARYTFGLIYRSIRIIPITLFITDWWVLVRLQRTGITTIVNQ